MVSYQQDIMERDGWSCGWCGTNQNLHVHHIIFRSAGGSDDSVNLLTLCEKDHRELAHGIYAEKYKNLFREIARSRTENRHEDLSQMFDDEESDV